MDFIRSRYSLENARKIINEKYDLGEIIQAEKLGGIANDNYKIEFANESAALKVYSHGQSNKDKINKEIEAVNIFRDAGIHTLDFVPGKDGKILQEYEGFNVVLTKFIDGPVLDSLQFTPELMFEVGKIVATIDKAAKNIDVSKFECMNFREEFDDVYEGIDLVIQKRGMQCDLTEYKANLHTIYDVINQLDNSDQKQFLHKDIWPWNLIKNEKGIYLLDFNDWAIGAPIIEISVAILEFSMFKSDKFNDEVAEAIIDGYKSIMPFNYTSEELLNSMLFICYLYFPYNVIQSDDESDATIYLKRIHTLLSGAIDLERVL